MIAVAILAVVLRLAWPMPVPAGPDFGIAALFGEHALCLAGPRTGDPARMLPLNEAPKGPAGQLHHDAVGCCQWHIGGGLIPLGTGAATRIVFATRADFVGATFISPVARSFTQAQARAPPSAAS